MLLGGKDGRKERKKKSFPWGLKFVEEKLVVDSCRGVCVSLPGQP